MICCFSVSDRKRSFATHLERYFHDNVWFVCLHEMGVSHSWPNFSVFLSQAFCPFLFFDSLFYFSVVCVSLSFSLPYFVVLAIFYSQFLILLILHSMEYVHPIHGAYPRWLSG